MSKLSPGTFFDLASFSHRKLFEECRYVWDALLHLKAYLKTLELGKIEVDVPAGVYLVDPHLISIGEGTVLEPGAYIKGPCVIGKRCTVRHCAYVRGDVLTGDECVIGHTTEAKHAILFNGVHADHFAYIGDAILGNRAHLGAGVILANLRLDGNEIVVSHKGQRIPTGLRKLGAIVGDDVQIGCNAVTNPGTLLGKGAFCYPTLNVSGYVPENTVVRPKDLQASS